MYVFTEFEFGAQDPWAPARRLHCGNFLCGRLCKHCATVCSEAMCTDRAHVELSRIAALEVFMIIGERVEERITCGERTYVNDAIAAYPCVMPPS